MRMASKVRELEYPPFWRSNTAKVRAKPGEKSRNATVEESACMLAPEKKHADYRIMGEWDIKRVKSKEKPPLND
jgi:hypothetical protein